ncbi:hypothetical protein [Streptomyces sp. NPDC051109]|uniref:hypothetical protein n=1 Tax=Streptomyces sp. NPDC051109 TaxID=3365642 RepID=UPI003789B6C1
MFAIPLIAYALCAAAGEGSGFIGARAAGPAFGSRLRDTPAERGSLTDGTDPTWSTGFSERFALLLASLSFLAFGAVILGPAQDAARRTWPAGERTHGRKHSRGAGPGSLTTRRAGRERTFHLIVRQ